MFYNLSFTQVVAKELATGASEFALFIYIHIYICIYIYLYLYLYMYIFIYVCVYIYVHIYTIKLTRIPSPT